MGYRYIQMAGIPLSRMDNFHHTGVLDPLSNSTSFGYWQLESASVFVVTTCRHSLVENVTIHIYIHTLSKKEKYAVTILSLEVEKMIATNEDREVENVVFNLQPYWI